MPYLNNKNGPLYCEGEPIIVDAETWAALTAPWPEDLFDEEDQPDVDQTFAALAERLQPCFPGTEYWRTHDEVTGDMFFVLKVPTPPKSTRRLRRTPGSRRLRR